MPSLVQIDSICNICAFPNCCVSLNKGKLNKQVDYYTNRVISYYKG